MSREIWEDIENFKGVYQVSNKGRVRSLDRSIIDCLGRCQFKRGKLLKLYKGKTGYFVVDLKTNDIRKMAKVHILLAQAFIPNPENKLQVNHKDGIKTNNNLTNLEWNTPSENLKHAYDNGLLKPHMLGKRGAKHPRHKKVMQIKNNRTIKIYNGSNEAARKTGLNQRNISTVCLGKRKTAGGFIWRYA